MLFEKKVDYSPWYTTNPLNHFCSFFKATSQTTILSLSLFLWFKQVGGVYKIYVCKMSDPATALLGVIV